MHICDVPKTTTNTRKTHAMMNSIRSKPWMVGAVGRTSGSIGLHDKLQSWHVHLPAHGSIVSFIGLSVKFKMSRCIEALAEMLKLMLNGTKFGFFVLSPRN